MNLVLACPFKEGLFKEWLFWRSKSRCKNSLLLTEEPEWNFTVEGQNLVARKRPFSLWVFTRLIPVVRAIAENSYGGRVSNRTYG